MCEFVDAPVASFWDAANSGARSIAAPVSLEPRISGADGAGKRERGGDTAGDSKSISSEYISIGSARYGHAAPRRDAWQVGPATNARFSASIMRQQRQEQKKNDGQECYQVLQSEQETRRALDGHFFDEDESADEDDEDYESSDDDECSSDEEHDEEDGNDYELMQKLVLGLKTSASLENAVEEGGDADTNPYEIPHGPPLPPPEERGDDLLQWMASVGGYDGATKVTQQTADGDETVTL